MTETTPERQDHANSHGGEHGGAERQDLRSRLIARLDSEPLFGAAETVDAFLAVLVEPPGDLLTEMREAARDAFSGEPARPDGTRVLSDLRSPWRALDDALAAAASVRWEDAARRIAELWSRLDEATGNADAWGQKMLTAQAERDQAKRDLAEANETYLAAASAATAAADTLRERIEQAEDERDKALQRLEAKEAIERGLNRDRENWRSRWETEKARADKAEATLKRVEDAVMNQSSTVSLTQAVLAALDTPEGVRT